MFRGNNLLIYLSTCLLITAEVSASYWRKPSSQYLMKEIHTITADLSNVLFEEEAPLDPTPPPHEKVAKMARYVVHLSDWIAISTISTRSPTKGRAFANVLSMSDGPNKNSSGVPYFYLTPMEMSVRDLKVDNNASITASLAETNYCARMEYDPMDPLCAHVILNGKIVEVSSAEEKKFAKRSLFSRHPEMADWPVGHNWFFAKMNIENILVLDFFGGAKTVPVEAYYKATPYP
uniref:CREG1 n=1 Tax=Caligus clemensi TaxID=344056 RepID=C1C112_CALCM|nr:CREG1 precursor [Caligus clemensi]